MIWKKLQFSRCKNYEMLRHISYDEPYNNLDNVSDNNPFNIYKLISNLFVWKLKFMQNGFFFFYIFVFILCIL